ncbi:ComEA family DNA-binding protein [Streptomyces sp. NPDC037389]|uniref:ComEA family DNA-binding protein n=1 Tax=Streptomyces sp. NPDC037389 TaxID=3155369 RepID=UPI0033F52103
MTPLDLGLGSLRDRAAADRGAVADPGAVAARPRRWPVPRGAMAALGDRLPLWVRLRCGIAPRTLAALTAVLVVAVALGAYHFWAGRPRTVRAPAREGPVAAPPPAAVPTVPGPTVPGPGSSARSVVVDVTGKVPRPGVQRLPPGSRVEDALEAAGGARPGADTTGLNQARVLMDGELIVVGAPAPGGPASAAVGGAVAGASPPGGGAAAGPISLNSATLEQLDALPGVGRVLAQHILDYRTQHGGFRSVADLRRVNGIGARRFTDLKPLVQP